MHETDEEAYECDEGAAVANKERNKEIIVRQIVQWQKRKLV